MHNHQFSKAYEGLESIYGMVADITVDMELWNIHRLCLRYATRSEGGRVPLYATVLFPSYGRLC